MKLSVMKTLTIAALSFVAIFLVGCDLYDDSDGGGDVPSPSVNVSGYWTGGASGGNSITMSLRQSGPSASGTATGGGESGDVAGTVDGNIFAFTIAWNISGQVANGVLTVDGNKMSGPVSEGGITGTVTLTR
jgi:hypothetical protein